MKLKNTTDYDEKRLREIIKFVKPSGVSGFDIWYKNSEYALAGTAYTEGTSYHNTKHPHVVIRVGSDKHFPYRIKAHKAYLPLDVYTREEAFVYTTAHELRHLWQKKHPRGWRVWGARGQYSERDADAYAIKKLRQWRKEH